MNNSISVKSAFSLDQLWELPNNPERKQELPDAAFEFRGISDLNRLIKSKLTLIAGRYDAIVGIPRSGLLAANIIALHLNLPLFSLENIANINGSQLRTSRRSLPHEIRKANAPLRILVVDDSTNTGEAMRRARIGIKSYSGSKTWSVQFLAIYVTQAATAGVDLHFQTIEQPRIFEWNFMHHFHAQNFLFDLDGVLCEDGPSESSEGIDEYINHLENARPKVLPSLKIGAIVTSRLEKYRKQTEGWLRRHKIIYHRLVMTNLPSAEERRRLALHAKFKAHVYKTLGGSLFIESESWQAKEIAAITGKPVYNLEENILIAASNSNASRSV